MTRVRAARAAFAQCKLQFGARRANLRIAIAAMEQTLERCKPPDFHNLQMHAVSWYLSRYADQKYHSVEEVYLVAPLTQSAVAAQSARTLSEQHVLLRESLDIDHLWRGDAAARRAAADDALRNWLSAYREHLAAEEKILWAKGEIDLPVQVLHEASFAMAQTSDPLEGCLSTESVEQLAGRIAASPIYRYQSSLGTAWGS